MNDVPLVKDNNINSINTSLIAVKKQLKQLTEAVGLIDVPDVDTSVFVKKSEVVDVVEAGNMNPVTSNAVVPVDEVTLGNMHSVASDAVAKIFLNTIDNTKFEMPTIAQTEVTANYTGILYMNVKQTNTATTAFYENNIQIAYSDMYTGDCFYNNFTLLIRKGFTYKWAGQATIDRQFFIPFF